MLSLTPREPEDLLCSISLARIAMILIQHGVPANCPDLAAWVSEHVTAKGCTLAEIRDFLGY